MRPATAFAERARQFQSAITVSKAGKSVNGKSPLDMLLLVAEQGAELTVEASGPDAAAAAQSLTELLIGLDVAGLSSG
jgi:phosphotransferase system HPr (HPr) family protein